MKKVTVVVFSLLMIVSLLIAGCNTNTPKEANNDKPQQTTDADNKNTSETIENGRTLIGNMYTDGFPIVKDKITLKFFAPQNPNIKDMYTNEFTKEYEQKTNVHIEWQLAPQQGLQEKRNLVLASGDYPDVFFGAGITRDDEMIYGPQGVFIPLNDLIEKYGVYTKKMMAEVSYIKKGITAPDGNIYSLPQVNECFHCMYSVKMWINKKWLDKLGLKMPETTEEFYNVLKAFKTQDPNGNGKNDEVPLSGAATGGWNSNIDGFLMNAFIINQPDHLYVDNGVVKLNADKPEYREGLRYIHKLYVDGLIDPAALTQPAEQLKQLAENPDVELLGAAPSGWFGVFTSLAGTRHKIYEPVPPLKGPNGAQYVAYFPYQYSTGQYVITSACKYPDVAMRWADWLYSPEAALRYIEHGREGKEWRKANPGEKDVRGRQAKWATIRPEGEEYGEIQNVHYYQMGPSYRSRDWRESWAVPEDIYGPEGFEARLHIATLLYEGHEVEGQTYPPVYFTPDQVNELAQLRTQINDYITESTARFITGELNIEKDWDTYVKTLENMGTQRYLEILQDAFNVYNKN